MFDCFLNVHPSMAMQPKLVGALECSLLTTNIESNIFYPYPDKGEY